MHCIKSFVIFNGTLIIQNTKCDDITDQYGFTKHIKTAVVMIVYLTSIHYCGASHPASVGVSILILVISFVDIGRVWSILTLKLVCHARYEKVKPGFHGFSALVHVTMAMGC